MRLRLDGLTAHIDWDDPALRLTAAQRAAMALDRELVVTAGAGTGKTHTLALRYVALILALANRGEVDVEQVVVLTFTDKAAHEMTERCRARLAAVARAARVVAPELDAREAGRGARLVSALDGALDDFDRARIGTFHGFCARIVHEHPAETGTPPGAAPLDPVEADRIVGETLERALSEHVAAHPDELAPLLDAFGTRRSLLEAGRSALDRLSVLEDVLRDHAEGRVSLDAQLRAARPTPAEAQDWLARVGRPSLALLVRLVAPSGGGPFVEDVLRPVQDGEQDGRLAEPDPEPLAVYARYRRVLEALLTDEGTLRRLDHHSVLGRKDRWPDERRYGLARDAARALTARLGDWEERARASRLLPTPADRALLAALGPFSRWVLASARALAATLDRDRRLTFEELQRRVVRSVSRDAAFREVLRARFRYLMVDEFQDTDEAQWALVRALGRAEPRVPEDRIFVVGDPKQAIYGFRGGDVTMFRAATDALGVPPLALSENFRSRSGLIEWFNAVFPSVLAADTPYVPLVAGRGEAGGEVTVVRTDEGAEAAGRVIAGVLADARWHDRALHPTPPVALLLRARTRQLEYEAALRRFGVPYVVVGGVGLWSRPEVLDVVNLLAALAHRDPVSWVGALRGPFVGLADDDVRPDVVPPAMERWEDLRTRLSAPDLLRLALDALVAALAAADPSGRAAANLERVAAQVDRWEGLPLAAVADRLLAQVLQDARAAEAALVPGEARVVVCTVHAAKGLEFPVVVVPEVHARPRGDVPALLVARPAEGRRLELASRVLDPDAPIETRVEPGRFSTLLDALRAANDAEDRRLLYVAATRARDRLVLIGAPQEPVEPGTRGSWMQRLAGVLPRATVILDQLPPPTPPRPPPPAPPPLTEPPPLPVRRAIELSASALDRFAQCPARWLRLEWMGVPEAPATARERSVALAAARGRVLHAILQDGLEDDAAAVGARWRAEASRIGALPDEREHGERVIREHLAATAADPHVREVLAAPGAAEVPFRVEHAGVVLRGRIDHLYLAPDGAVVLDWKSEALAGRSAEAVAAGHALQLAAYGWAADRVLRARGRPGVVRGELYLTEVGRAVAVPLTDRLGAVPELLAAVAEAVEVGWAEVEATSIRPERARPCASCGYRARGCRGQPG